MLRRLLVAAALVLSSPAFAYTCTRMPGLGAMDTPATRAFGNAFRVGAEISDCWRFSIATASDVAGSTTETDADFWFLPRYIELETISLWDLGTGMQVGSTDLTPDSFGFTGLAAGSYELLLSGYVSPGYGIASYAGKLTTAPVGTVSEPSLPALLVMALGAAGLAGRRGLTARD